MENLIKLTFEYDSGKTVILTGQAVEGWLTSYLAYYNAFVTLQQQQQEAQADGPKVINLLEAIARKRGETE